MQVKATAPAMVPSLSIESRPGDVEVIAPVVVRVAPVMALSREELVAALLLAEVTTDDLAAMNDVDVRHEVGYALTAFGQSAVQDTVYAERNVPARNRDADLIRHIELCEVKVASAFGLAPAVRSRVASRSIGTSRTLVKVAA
jgi:hypothetical protein